MPKSGNGVHALIGNLSRSTELRFSLFEHRHLFITTAEVDAAWKKVRVHFERLLEFNDCFLIAPRKVEELPHTVGDRKRQRIQFASTVYNQQCFVESSVK